MRYEILNASGDVENTILASHEFVEAHHAGRWRLAKSQYPDDAAPLQRIVSRKAFLSRFNDGEAIDIDMASMGATREAAAVRRYLSKVNAAQHIDLVDEETRTGVQALEAAGLLQPGRALAILDAPIEPKEIP